MNFQARQLSLNEINIEAEKFLDHHHPSYNLPIPIEEIVDLKLKIDIIPIPGLKQALQGYNLDIDGFIASDFKSISIDADVQKTYAKRFRFTLAHEIAHRQLHGYFYEQLKIDSIDDWKTIVNEIPDWPISVLEYQANMFAGLVLVPQKMLKEEYLKAKEKAEKIVKNHGYNGDLIWELVVGFLGRVFYVSEASMRRCLDRDGYKK